MSDQAVNDDYVVGYGKPPLHSRWASGVSGNPSGAKKRARTLTEEVSDVLSQRIAINQNGQRQMITKLRATVMQTVNKAISGDARSTKLVLELARQSDNEEALSAVLHDAKASPATVQIFQLPDNGR